MKAAPTNLEFNIGPQGKLMVDCESLIKWFKDELILTLTDKEAECLASDFLKDRLVGWEAAIVRMTKRFEARGK